MTESCRRPDLHPRSTCSESDAIPLDHTAAAVFIIIYYIRINNDAEAKTLTQNHNFIVRD